MKRYIALLPLLLSLLCNAQSESHNFITYDTAIKAPYAGITWHVRITRSVNDSTSRPAFIFIPGQGEMGNNVATMQTYGPHYWLNHGWDGSIRLGNGIHYPYLFTIISSNTYMTAQEASDVIDILLKAYPIKKGSVYASGLSQGAFALSAMLLYEAQAGDETGMKKIKALVCLEGASSELQYPASTWSRGAAGWGHWAAKYGGKFFGLEGTADYRVVSRISKPMNDSLANSGYFSYETIGGGNHCCWNDMLNPSANNWTSVGKLGTYNSGGVDPNTMGTYKPGDNIFTWMFKQGDTSMVGGSVVTPTIYYNTARADTFRTVCPPGYLSFNSVVIYQVPAKKYSSTVSQQDADNQAKADSDANGQNYANANGQCKKIFAILYPPLLNGKAEIIFDDGTTLIQ